LAVHIFSYHDIEGAPACRGGWVRGSPPACNIDTVSYPPRPLPLAPNAPRICRLVVSGRTSSHRRRPVYLAEINNPRCGAASQDPPTLSPGALPAPRGRTGAGSLSQLRLSRARRAHTPPQPPYLPRPSPKGFPPFLPLLWEGSVPEHPGGGGPRGRGGAGGPQNLCPGDFLPGPVRR